MPAQADPILAEARLAEAVESADEPRIARELAEIGRDNIEFTGRCFALAIVNGLVGTSLLFGREGFHLNVMDEPAVQQELAESSAGMRGLMSFMQRYRHCKAQRTYYLQVVQEPLSLAPIRALLQEGVGLTTRDCSELLSLAVRQDNTELARVLVEGGAQLAEDIRIAVPDDLGENVSSAASEGPWAELLSPRGSLGTIAFVLEQLGDEPCLIRADWFKLYFRDPQFSAKLALIAPHSRAERCEDPSALLAELARGGHVKAVRDVLNWEGLERGCADEALAIAREKGHVEIASAIMQARRTATPAIQPLEF